MSEKIPVSVHILTLNSAATVEKALQSVQNCEEILVIDGASTDDTISIAKKYGATVIDQPTQGETNDFSAVRNHALQYTTKNWIFSLDSDESATPELIDSIRKAVQGEPAAYNITRKYVLDDGRVVEHATTYPNKRLYFFHRDVITQWIKPVHEKPELKSGTSIKDLNGACLAPLGSISDYKKKNLRYLKLEVERSKGKGWGHWFVHRLLHTLRSRMIMLIRLLLIRLIPRKGAKLPLKHEFLRFWYGWKLILATLPL